MTGQCLPNLVCLRFNLVHLVIPVLELYHPAILDGGQFLILGAVLLKEALKWDTAIVVPPIELRLPLFN